MLHLLSEKFDISTLIILNIAIGYNIQVAQNNKNISGTILYGMSIDILGTI